MTPIPIMTDETKEPLNKTSWVCVFAKTNNDVMIFYHNQNESAEIESFEAFFECCIDKLYPRQGIYDTTKEIKKDFAHIEGYSTETQDDYDEQSKKQFTSSLGQGFVISCYDKGIAPNLIPLEKIIKDAEKNLQQMEKYGKKQGLENIEFSKNPYRYNGVSKKDFF